MTRVIYEYPIEFAPDSVPMPRGAEIVHVGQQHGVLTVWARVDPTAPVEDVTVEAVATGEAYDDGRYGYLGTVQMPNGLVWHVMWATS